MKQRAGLSTFTIERERLWVDDTIRWFFKRQNQIVKNSTISLPNRKPVQGDFYRDSIPFAVLITPVKTLLRTFKPKDNIVGNVSFGALSPNAGKAR